MVVIKHCLIVDITEGISEWGQQLELGGGRLHPSQ